MVFSILPLADALLRRSFIASGSAPAPSPSTTTPLSTAGSPPHSPHRTHRSPLRSEAYQAAALARLLDALGVRRLAAAAGTSYGGFVAYHLARPRPRARRPRRRRQLRPPQERRRRPRLPRPRRRRGRGRGARRGSDAPGDVATIRALMGLAFYRPPRFVPDFVLRDIIRSLYNDKLEEKMELIKGVTVGKKDEFQLTPLEQEVLIIWGEHDQIFPVKKAFEVKRQLGEKAKLEILKKTGHMPQMEDSKRFNRILLNFLLDAPAS
uniref:AB hydrolase-1 domain-containing protein n=1 Tax=Ananas comosus var. bracteatus TaxID=296719 RepID=A0A6V7PNA9_ANACO|nr:unnamed protein product [Ananas comosus var. bracteatus]